jgi:hypothetical protein
MAGSSSYGCSCDKGSTGDSGIGDAAALAAGAIAAFLIYQAITMAAAGKRKKRENENLSPFEMAKDMIVAGRFTTHKQS